MQVPHNRPPEEIIARIGELKAEGCPTNQISSRIYEEFSFSLSSSSVERWLKKIREGQVAIKQLNDAIEEKLSYDFDEVSMNVTFHIGKGKSVVLPLKLIDDIHACYTVNGDDMTQQECIEKFRITPQARNLLKSRMGLTKQSDIMSIITMERLDKMGGNVLDEKMSEALDSHVYNKFKGRFKPNYDKSFKKLAKESLKITAGLDGFLEHLQTYLIHYKPIDINFKLRQPENSDTSVYVFSDIHLGMEGTDRIAMRIHKLTNDMINDKASHIEIVNLGDLAETFTEGGMHPGQVETMEGLYGFDLMMFVVKQMEMMVIELAKAGKIVSLTGIGGNHDRTLQSHNQDIRRTGALIVYELVKRGLQNIGAKIQYYTEKINSFDSDGMHFIIHHGDEGFDKRKPEDILWKHGKQGMSNIILHGDKHRISMNETKEGIMIGTPALANRGDFARRIDARSQPGYVVIRRNEDDIDVLLRRMK